MDREGAVDHHPAVNEDVPAPGGEVDGSVTILVPVNVFTRAPVDSPHQAKNQSLPQAHEVTLTLECC